MNIKLLEHDLYFMVQWFCLTSYSGIVSVVHALSSQINVGHSNLYFMIHWFFVISGRLFDGWRSYTFDIKLSIYIQQIWQVQLQETVYSYINKIYFYFYANCSQITYQLRAWQIPKFSTCPLGKQNSFWLAQTNFQLAQNRQKIKIKNLFYADEKGLKKQWFFFYFRKLIKPYFCISVQP